MEIKRSGRFQARLVACGYSQIPGVDFTEVYSPVVNDITFRITMIMMLLMGLDAVIFDVERLLQNRSPGSYLQPTRDTGLRSH
jgi:hypothetical protein